MSARLRPFGPEHVEAVAQLNQRLVAGGSDFRMPGAPQPAREGARTWLESFVAEDGPSVRGGYVIKHQPFWLRGELTNVDNLQLPLSEGSVDPRYNLVGVQLLGHAQRSFPRLYALGMGGMDRPLPRMLATLGWKLTRVPFFFRVVNPTRFLRNLVYARTTPWRRLVADALALTRLGWLVRPVQLALTRPVRFQHVEVEEFGSWADALWERARSSYALVALRDAAELNRQYPPGSKFLRVRAGGAGWAVMLATQMSGHKQFGAMKLGSIVDCLALPGREAEVVAAATRVLVERRVDLIVTNQLHRAWTRALRRRGYLAGPSNYALALSKVLAEGLDLSIVHMTRGDGDGPIHL